MSKKAHKELRVEQLPGGYVVQMHTYGRRYSVKKVVYRHLGDVLETVISFLTHRDEDKEYNHG